MTDRGHHDAVDRAPRGGGVLHPVPAGALLAAVGVALGAAGAHLLADTLSTARLATFETAVRYQMYHALGIVAIGALPRHTHPAAWLLLAGNIVFSGSLYALAFTELRWMGAVAPIGGLLQILGWLTLAVLYTRVVTRP